MKNLKAKVFSGVKWTSLSTIVVTSIQLIQLIVLSRILNPNDFGIIAIVTIIINFLRFFSDFGISSAIVHKQNITNEQYSSLFWLNIFVGIVIFFIMLLCNPIINIFYKVEILSSIIKTFAIIFLFISIGSLFQTIFQKELQFDLLAKIEILSSVFGACVTIFFALINFQIWAIVIGQLVSNLIRNITLFVVGIKKQKINFHFKLNDLKDFLSFGLFQLGERIINFISERIDQLLIGSILGVNQLGYYNFAFNLASQPLALINPIINKVAFPVFSKIQNDTNELKKGFLKILKIIMLINTPILVGFSIIAPIAIPFFFGNKWTSSIVVLQILCFVILFRCFGNPVGSLILSKGRADIGFKWNLLLFILSIPIVYFTSKYGGIIAVAIMLLIVQLILQIPSYLIQVKPFIGNCAKQYFLNLMLPILLTLPMIIFFFSFSILMNNNELLFFQVFFGIISYLIGLYLIEKAEFQNLISLFKKI